MILSIGDATIDHYINTGDKFAGGIATNFAVHLTRFDIPVTLVSAIGQDENGKAMMNTLHEEKIDTSYIYQSPGLTSTQKIRLTGNNPTFFDFEPGVLKHFTLPHEVIELMQVVDYIFVPLTDGLKHLFEEVVNIETKAPKIVDISKHSDIEGFSHGDTVAMMLHYLDKMDIIFIGGNSSMVAPIELIAKANPEKLIVLTLGSKGSMVFHHGEKITQHAIWVKDITDTTGCGDAFRSGFIVNYSKDHNIQTAIQHAAEHAATVASQLGAF